MLQQLGITLTDEQYQQLLDLINQLSKLDIDWDSLADNVSSLIGQASDYLHSDEGQSFLAKLQDIINSFFDWLRSVFGGSDSASGDQIRPQVLLTQPVMLLLPSPQNPPKLPTTAVPMMVPQ